MRRFMQTFLLAPQSPKKYYVHNDIFRYQDEVFHDLEGESDGAGDDLMAGGRCLLFFFLRCAVLSLCCFFKVIKTPHTVMLAIML